MGKMADNFESVYKAVNHHRAHNATVTKTDLKRIVTEECRLTMAEWYSCLSYARKGSPNLYEQFYRNIGQPVPPVRGAEPHPPTELEVATEEEEEPDQVEASPATPAEVLASIINWLDPLEETDRKRVLRSVNVYFEDP